MSAYVYRVRMLGDTFYFTYFIISWSLTVSQDEHMSSIRRRKRNNIDIDIEWVIKSALKTISNQNEREKECENEAVGGKRDI